MTKPTNDREVFEYVKNHLLTQGRRAASPRGECMYRGPGGTKCAVGCLLTDEHAVGIEGLSAVSPEVQRALKRSLGFMPLRTLVDDLQAIHDYSSPDKWPASLDVIERRFFPPTSTDDEAGQPSEGPASSGPG